MDAEIHTSGRLYTSSRHGRRGTAASASDQRKRQTTRAKGQQPSKNRRPRPGDAERENRLTSTWPAGHTVPTSMRHLARRPMGDHLPTPRFCAERQAISPVHLSVPRRASAAPWQRPGLLGHAEAEAVGKHAGRELGVEAHLPRACDDDEDDNGDEGDGDYITPRSEIGPMPSQDSVPAWAPPRLPPISGGQAVPPVQLLGRLDHRLDFRADLPELVVAHAL